MKAILLIAMAACIAALPLAGFAAVAGMSLVACATVGGDGQGYVDPCTAHLRERNVRLT